MNNSANLVTITINDLEKIAAIEKQTDSKPWTQGMLKGSLEKDHCWGVLVDNTLVGYLIFSLQANECSILKLAIIPEEQHKGYATNLLKELINFCQKLKIERILLEVRASNQKAQNLYHNLGFTEIGTRKNYYPTKTGHEDALVLTRKHLCQC